MIVVKEVEDKKEWEDFIYQNPDANFLQSWHFGEFHKSLGKEVERIGFFDENKLIGVMQAVIENAKRGRYMTISGGPIIDWKNKSLVKLVFTKVKNIAGEKKCVFVRVRPQLIEDDYTQKVFADNGLQKSQMHLTADLTYQLDITKTEDELLAGMRKATRYEIRKAIKEEIKITKSQDPKDVKEFYDIQLETAKRQKFVPFSYKFFYEQFKTFFNEDKAILYRAYFEKKLLAGAFIIFYNNEAVYHYGVGTEEGRRHPGAYLIQWEAIKEAKSRGLKHYNFWGVAPVDAKNHRFYGVSIFKRGFGGEDVQYLHAHDLVIKRFLYLINYLIERIRKKIRKV